MCVGGCVDVRAALRRQMRAWGLCGCRVRVGCQLPSVVTAIWIQLSCESMWALHSWAIDSEAKISKDGSQRMALVVWLLFYFYPLLVFLFCFIIQTLVKCLKTAALLWRKAAQWRSCLGFGKAGQPEVADASCRDQPFSYVQRVDVKEKQTSGNNMIQKGQRHLKLQD